MKSRLFSSDKERIWVLAGFAAIGLLWAIFLLWGIHIPKSTWASVLPGFQEAEVGLGASGENSVKTVIAVWLFLLTVGFSMAWATFRNLDTLRNPDMVFKVFSGALYFAAVYAIFKAQTTSGSEATWYNIQTAMTNPSGIPVMGQRLLLVWPAIWIKALKPGITYFQAYLLIQILGTIVAVYVVGVWSSLFIGKQMKFIGQLFLVLMMSPAFAYWTFYDIGIVIFTTWCLLLLYQRRYWLFCAVFLLAVFNHPNVLLLVPTAVFILWGNEQRSKIVQIVVVTLAGWAAIRVLLNTMVPLAYGQDARFWWNMRQVAELRRTLIEGQLVMLPWYLSTAAAFSYAEPFLKRAAILIPMQYAIYTFVGQYNEPKILNGCLPILIGILLCYIRTLKMTSSSVGIPRA